METPDTGKQSVTLPVELANLRISRDRGLDGTSRDGKRLDGPSSGEGDPGVRMGAANSNGSPMSSSADSRGRSGSAELDGTSSEDGEQRRFRSVLAKSWYWRALWAGVSGGWPDSGSGSETLQTPDDRLLPIKVAGVGEFHRLVVRDPDPEKCMEDFSFKGTGECEWHECPCVGECVVARLSHGDEHDVFVHFAGLFICHGRVAGRTRETRGKVNKVILITGYTTM